MLYFRWNYAKNMSRMRTTAERKTIWLELLMYDRMNWLGCGLLAVVVVYILNYELQIKPVLLGVSETSTDKIAATYSPHVQRNETDFSRIINHAHIEIEPNLLLYRQRKFDELISLDQYPPRLITAICTTVSLPNISLVYFYSSMINLCETKISMTPASLINCTPSIAWFLSPGHHLL